MITFIPSYLLIPYPKFGTLVNGTPGNVKLAVGVEPVPIVWPKASPFISFQL